MVCAVCGKHRLEKLAAYLVQWAGTPAKLAQQDVWSVTTAQEGCLTPNVDTPLRASATFVSGNISILSFGKQT